MILIYERKTCHMGCLNLLMEVKISACVVQQEQHHHSTAQRMQDFLILSLPITCKDKHMTTCHDIFTEYKLVFMWLILMSPPTVCYSLQDY